MESATQSPPSLSTLESFNPATGELVGTVPTITPEQVQAVVDDVARVQPAWAELPLKTRAGYMRRAAEALLDDIDEIAELLVREQGKPRTEAYTMELLPTVDALHWCAKAGQKVLADEKVRMTQAFTLSKSAHFSYEPIGVVGVIAPWNYPWSIPFGEVAIALMAGNGVVLKPASLTPLLGERIAQVFEKAGLPEGLVRVVTTSGGEERPVSFLWLIADRFLADSYQSHLRQPPDEVVATATGDLDAGVVAHDHPSTIAPHVLLDMAQVHQMGVMNAEEAQRREERLELLQRPRYQHPLSPGHVNGGVVPLRLAADDMFGVGEDDAVGCRQGDLVGALPGDAELLEHGVDVGGDPLGRLQSPARLLHRRGQLIAVDRLDQIVERAGAYRADGVMVVGGGEDHLEVLPARLLQQVEPAAVGHLDIEEDQVWGVVADRLDAGGHRVRRVEHPDIGAMALQQRREGLAAPALVVDDDGSYHGF